ncbi:NADPH-dependent FMN reductase [Methylobacter sp. S3L5C]|uniref:NADPH-dependent FMN reductase n=1 Tax=Methylobacter sp. S3L5C TaxID=2839024 RepID=UPI001FAB53E5|nr:NADPH-dependent FMN reductase [Methylobacter sp. S3L5C]UOA07325.1 NAD(P)H-dependent oxidoreductase [Methylobacter sp. S3L5C]
MNVLAICGSLRSVSINRMLLHAAIRLSPPDMEIVMFPDIGKLPSYNPDLEHCVPVQVAKFRTQVADSQALLIASPEYAHGVTGSLKNALDWLVSFEPFANKPVALLNASPRARHSDAALREILKTMSAELVESASISVRLLSSSLTEDEIANHPEISIAIASALFELQAIASHRILR